jgi:O-methyltransferase involved in polyketide biosynthesis
MAKLDISTLTESQATLLMPLWARAKESLKPKPLLRDWKAAEIVDSLDFDFDLFTKKSVPQADYCVRASVIDQLVRQFLDRHPDGTVIEYGVGLDSRFDRLDNGRVHWVEVDFPDVIDLRQHFFEATDRRSMIQGSLTESAWIPAVKACGNDARLFVAEGVLYFLSDAQVRELVCRMIEYFPGSSFIFDAQSPLYLSFSNWRQPIANAELKFSLGNPSRLKEWHPDLRVEQFVGFGDSPFYDEAIQRLGVVKRLARRVCPWVRNMFKIVQIGW